MGSMILFWPVLSIGVKLMVGRSLWLNREFLIGIFGGGLIFGLNHALMGGGEFCLQHLLLRFLLSSQRLIPWNYARFLDCASDRIFLRKVGGGYIFVHRMLLDHFASLEKETAVTRSEQRVSTFTEPLSPSR
jgi:hypothetical protein